MPVKKSAPVKKVAPVKEKVQKVVKQSEVVTDDDLPPDLGKSSSPGIEESNAEEVSVGSKSASNVAKAVAKIKAIEVRFTKVVRDVNKRVLPIGTATATYDSGAILTVPISGGANVKTYGITDAVKNLAIFRVEPSTYRNHNGDAMPYALFYHGGEALHIGRLDKISHGCVHIADWDKIRKLHQDVVKNKTKVTVVYDAGVLNKVMKQIL